MPRKARIILPNCPHHIIQRGHNRQTVFAADEDYKYYLDTLKEWKKELNCKVHAYCLMTNHIHLIVDPGENPENIGLLMKRLAGRQTRYVNALENRSGSLWEGRYKSSIIDSNHYLLACCRYIECNPLRAGMVESVWEYKWSSSAAKVGLKKESWLDFDDFYLGLDDNEEKRIEKYKAWMRESASDEELKLIRNAVQRGQLTGGNMFVNEISKKLGMRIEMRGQGRPRK